MAAHDCIQWKLLGELKAKADAFVRHVTEGNRWRVAIVGIVLAVILQVGGFLYLWGGLDTTVKRNEKDVQRVFDKLDALVEKINK